MYRILLTRGHKAYAVNCDEEFHKASFEYDNLFDENVNYLVGDGDVVVLIEDIEDFDRFFPNYELEIVERE